MSEKILDGTLNGIILFGWTTALILAFVQYMIETPASDECRSVSPFS